MYSVNELLQRISALQMEYTPQASSMPYALHVQAQYPYWLNRVEVVNTDGDSEDFDVDEIQVEMYLVVGHRSEGYAGELEKELYNYVPGVIRWFNQHETLQSKRFTDPFTDLDRARITRTRPMVVLENSGVGSEQIAAIFTLTCQFSAYTGDS